jgi:SAM-dependent methyltransferase
MKAVTPALPESALETYERMAPYYDAFTADYDYEAWLAGLERLALEHGLRGRRLLDLACGTGKSFMPLLNRGYAVTACDLSPAMVELAREKLAPGQAEVRVADMRELPALGEFDLVTCLDDALNYLLSDEELRATFRGVAAQLAERGLFVFDVNSRATYRDVYGRDEVSETEDRLICWRAADEGGRGRDGLFEGTFESFARVRGDLWRRSRSRHVQRHYGREQIASALAAAGLRLVVVRGQSTGARLDRSADEEWHTKVVYVAARRRPRRAPRAKGGEQMKVRP